MESDAEQVQLVMRLLLESALVRCAVKEAVRAELRADDGSVHLQVRCPVAPCDPASLHVLLEPFRTPSLNHYTSFGCLDLPLAAEVMRQLQGEVTLSLSAENELVAQVRFPRAATPTAPLWEEAAAEERLAA